MSSHFSREILRSKPKNLVISGPSGFLGQRVVDEIIHAHQIRMSHGLAPGMLILLSGSPGKLMAKLTTIYNEKIKTVRASRVDFYTQHDKEIWIHHLGSLGCGGRDSVFVNLAAVAGPVVGIRDAMFDVNYKGAIAAANACKDLGFGHFIQSSTQATVTERAGQVPYSRGKAMADFALSRMSSLPVTIACLGVLYSKITKGVGQDFGSDKLNLTDLSLLPLTPIMGSGRAPLQPMEVSDAAKRLAFLALTDPESRLLQTKGIHQARLQNSSPDLRIYDAVGPETMSILELLQKRFAKYQKKTNFYPVHVGYRNFERILNIRSLGNLNRQFVSLLRSEQDGQQSVIGDSAVFDSLLPDEPLLTLDDAMSSNVSKRCFPYIKTIKWVLDNPRIIPHGIRLSLEIIESFVMRRRGDDKFWS